LTIQHILADFISPDNYRDVDKIIKNLIPSTFNPSSKYKHIVYNYYASNTFLL
jgi:hypothetical protein